MLDFLDPELLRPYRLTFADLNPEYLERLGERLKRLGVEGQLVVDDFEQTQLAGAPALLVMTLLLEHIEWRRAVPPRRAASVALLAAPGIRDSDPRRSTGTAAATPDRGSPASAPSRPQPPLPQPPPPVPPTAAPTPSFAPARSPPCAVRNRPP